MTPRHTSIQIIRQRFGKTDALTTPANELDAVCSIADAADDSPLPPAIASLMAQRSAVREKGSNSVPRPGQILRVPPRANDASGTAPNEFLAVLLDAPQTPEKWRGWLVGRDPEYATEWDMVLGPEDDPRDPMCQVVQVWNPVSLAWKDADQVVAELTPDRLAAVRSLAKDCGERFLPEPIEDTRMGVLIARELSDGTGIVTGTPIAGTDDPRGEYQTIYCEAAFWISVGAPLAAPVSAITTPETPSPWLWLKRLWTGGDNHFSVWRASGALATLVLVPLLFVLVSKSPSEQSQVASQSISVDPKSEFRYISSGIIQELRVASPEAHARLIETRLSQLGALPEIRSSGPALVSVYADIGKTPEADRLRLLKDFGLGVPQDGILRIDIYQDAEKAAPDISGGNSR